MILTRQAEVGIIIGLGVIALSFASVGCYATNKFLKFIGFFFFTLLVLLDMFLARGI